MKSFIQLLQELSLPYIHPAPRYPGGILWDYRSLPGTGFWDWLFSCKDPPCSLLKSANIIYNHVSTGGGRFYRLEGGGLAFIEEQTHHTTILHRERVCTCVRKK